MLEKNKKLISVILIILIIAPVVLFSKPKKAEALGPVMDFLTEIFTGGTMGTSATGAGANVTNTALSLKNVAKEILRQLIMTAEKKLLQQMTKSTINWINSGFHGSPLFLTNPDSFFHDLAKTEIKNIIGDFGNDPSKFPFGQQFSLNLINSYKRTVDQDAAYSLSSFMSQTAANNYRNNFNAGGWNGFLINTQYPQNNYLGFNMIATNQLAKKLAGTEQTTTQKVQTTLQQGAGFLSPTTCPKTINASYDNGINEFNPPTYNSNAYVDAHPYPSDDCTPLPAKPTIQDYNTYQACEAVFTATKQDWLQKSNADVAAFQKKSACINPQTGKSALVATTPGNVVGSQITRAMGSSFSQSELGAALGNSIGAVLDSLVSHFLDQGLSSLASTINPAPAIDTWSYNGQTLGSPTDNGNTAWDAGPDVPIVLGDFKNELEGYDAGTCANITDSSGVIAPDQTDIPKAQCDSENGTWTMKKHVPGDIDNTTNELALIYNESPTNPGITQMLGLIWPKARELDICQPGPDLGWKDRMLSEVDRNSKKLSENQNSDSGDKSAQAQLALNELKYAVSFFQDWIENKMMAALPDSVSYMDAVNELSTFSQQGSELTDARRLKIQALARLKSIDSVLATIVTQPATGSSQEKILISLWKQYQAISDSVSNPTSIDNTTNELATDTDELNKLSTLITQCNTERKTAGWSIPGGWNSTGKDTENGQAITGNEKALFCDKPIIGGYDHESFTHKNDGAGSGNGGIFGVLTMGVSTILGAGGAPAGGGNGTVTYPDVPYVNATNVLQWTGTWGIFNHTASIRISCNIIFKSNTLQYKGDLPETPYTASIEPKETYVQMPPDTGADNLGTCTAKDPTTGDLVSESDVTQSNCLAVSGTWVPDDTAIPVPTPTSTTIDFTNPPPPVPISIVAGGTTSLNLSGGTGPYVVQMTPSPAIANAQLSGNILMISGISAGNTSVILADSSGKTVTVDITVTATGTP